MLLRLAACLLLTAPALAQIDLPDRPVRPTPPAPAAKVPPAPRGNLAERVTGAKAAEEAAKPALDLPVTVPPQPAPSAGELPRSATPGGALAAAATFILDEVQRARPGDARLLNQAAGSLLNLGEPGLQAARTALSSNTAGTLEVAARVLLAGGVASDSELVLTRVRGRLPRDACAPLVAALAEVDPVRASPALFVELLGHPQSQVRAAAQRELAKLPPSELVAALPPALASRQSDTRLRAVVLASGAGGADALELIVRRLGDSSAEVARKAVEVLAASDNELVGSLLLQRAFDSRWILRENAYALLALIEREDLRIEPLLGLEHADALLGGLGSSDAFVAGSSAAALAGIGFRSPSGERTAWLDREVPARLVRCLSGAEFHNDISALQASALRRMNLISGTKLGTEGARWVEWWAEVRADFVALRAVLPGELAAAEGLRVDCLDSATPPHAFRVLGPDPLAAQGAPIVDRALILSSVQAAELFEVLRRESIFEAERLPGTRGAGRGHTRGTRSMEVSLGGRSKVFSFPADATEPWFQRAFETARAFYEQNSWQLWLAPGEEASARQAFEREGQWWAAEHTPAERDQRLKERIFAAMRGLQVSERDEAVRELERLGELEGRIQPADLDTFREFLREERFLGTRTRTLYALCLQAAGQDEQGRLPEAAGQLLVGDLEHTFGQSAALELQQTLEAMGPSAARAAATDSRTLVRALAPLALAKDPDPESVALLMGLLEDEDPGVEAAAALALGEARVEAARTELLVRARVSEPAVRSAALVAIGRLGGEGVRDALLIGLSERETPEVSEAAARGLVALRDPSTAALFVSLLTSGGEDPLVVPARAGLLALGPQGWPELLRAVRTPGHRSRREAALLLSRQAVPEAAPVLLQLLADDGQDARVAAELCVLSGVDLRAEPDPAVAWWDWWNGVVHDDATAWFLGALAREGRDVPPAASIADEGSAEGAVFLLGVLNDGATHQAERARRELSRLLGRELSVPPSAGSERTAWLAELSDEIARRYN